MSPSVPSSSATSIPRLDQQRQRAAAGGLQVVRVRGDDQDAFDLVAELADVEVLFV